MPLSKKVLIKPGAGFRLHGEEASPCARSGQHDLVTVRQIGEQLLRRNLRRRGEVELAADQERLQIRRPYLAVLVLIRCGRPGVNEPAVTPAERCRDMADVCVIDLLAGGEVVPRGLGVGPPEGGVLTPDEEPREQTSR